MTGNIPPDTLHDALAEALALWTGAVKNRRSPLHTPVVCTWDGGAPAPRIMVLRDVRDDASHFRFHTDARSPKVTQIANGAPVALLGYDAEARVQLTVKGRAHVGREGDATDAAWNASALSSRRCYLAAFAPGTQVDAPTSGLPATMLDRAPTEAESRDGRANFAILTIEAEELEWLRLTSCGNKRAVFRRAGDAWHGEWITP